jgi:hypothetical protein
VPCRFPSITACLVCLGWLIAASSGRADIPPWLPQYDLDIHIQTEQHQVVVKERVRWTNPHQTATNKIVFNAHAHYSAPDSEVPMLAKMLEILRLSPSDALDFGGPALTVKAVQITPVETGHGPSAGLDFHFQTGNDTALEVLLPFAVAPGQTVSIDLDLVLRLPQKQGRWGQWKGVTFLAQWLPVVAFYDDHGWQPAPFVPWHQPFFNEAGLYDVHVTLPANQTLAASSTASKVQDLGNSWQRIDLAPICVRDFALCSSSDFQVFTGQAGATTVRVLALPGHEWYAQEMVKIAEEAIPIYNRWFGPYPYPQFTVVESYFGWNGNECGGLVMIDERIFNLPHIARNFVDALLTHETCHQWWYNLVGTNGYAETWMDEGLAVHFSHKVMDEKVGKNNTLLDWPKGLEWLPNIHRDDYRYFGMTGAMGRGEMGPVVQDMPGFGHLVNLMAMTYDRGGKVVGMIEDRLGSANFLDFMKHVRAKYEYRILRVADYQHELEAYTGHSWQEFFQNWLYHAYLCDWTFESVEMRPVTGSKAASCSTNSQGPLGALSRFCRSLSGCDRPQQARIVLRQKGQCKDETILGFRFEDGDGCQLRIPIDPCRPLLVLEEYNAQVIADGQGTVIVDIVLPRQPAQITIDPDKVLLHRQPANNCWKPEINFRFTPLFTQLEETDITNKYDRWNVIVGPWIYGSSYEDPWYTRSEMVGLRASVYRTQEVDAGAYLAYRTDDRNIVAGADAMWDHLLMPHFQAGINVERSLATLDNGDPQSSRGVVWGRYVFMYGDSLYLPPFQYVEAFAAVLNHNLPYPSEPEPNTDPFNQLTVGGVHYHQNYLTPYWDPEAGFQFDATFEQGAPLFGEHRWAELAFAQLSWVKGMPAWMEWTREVPGMGWLMDTRWAFRIHGAAALPDDGRFFPLGGADLFRGYDDTQRQGNLNWVGSVEWRVPLWQDIEYPVCDHIATVKNLFAALFCDTGEAYVNGHSIGSAAECFGVGLCLDVSWFGMIERTMLRVDVAKTINDNTPTQYWLSIEHPF